MNEEDEAFADLERRLAQQRKQDDDDIQEYKKPWVGLTDEERGQIYADWRFNGGNSSNLELCKAIEAKLREKNGGNT